MVSRSVPGRLLVIGLLAASPAGAATVSPPARDGLIQTATLTAGGPVVDRVAISHGTIAAHSYASMYGGRDTGVDVFTEPSSGWAKEPPPAVLAAANGEPLSAVATTGDTVFAGAPESGSAGGGAVYVFSEPAGGWSGARHESAVLVASDGGARTALGGSVAASGSTAVATGAGAAYLFTEPSGGWSGTIQEAAKLVAPSGVALGSVAISGNSVVAGGGGAAYVFTEPSSGWLGTLHPVAKLLPSDGLDFGGDLRFGHSVAISGPTVVSDAMVSDVPSSTGGRMYLFTRPSRGWAGTLHERSVVGFPTDEYTLLGDVAVSGPTAAAVSDEPGPDHMCPCTGSVYAVSKSAGGWSGTSTVDASASVPTSLGGLAVDGSTLVVGGDDGVHVFGVLDAPSISRTSLTGLRTGAPALRFTAAAGSNAPALQSIAIKLPAGLRFGGRLRGHVVVRGATAARLWLSRGRLVVFLARPKRRISVSVTAPALAEGAALRRAAAAYRHLPLVLVLSTVDSAGRTTALPITVAAR